MAVELVVLEPRLALRCNDHIWWVFDDRATGSHNLMGAALPADPYKSKI